MSQDRRGREPVVSTGRGGAGNFIRSPSRGVDPSVVPGGERGRDGPRDASIDRVTHSGRGGAGNIRSPSRNPADRLAESKEEALQDKLVAESRGRQADAAFSTGRGGAGNISRSKSRSRSAVRAVNGNGHAHHEAHHHDPSHLHVTGRGGFGNITEEQRSSMDEEKRLALEKYEAEVKAKHDVENGALPPHSGRGGAGNIGAKYTDVDLSTLTLEEQEAHAKVHANDKNLGLGTGRGGAGNISAARTTKESSPSPDGERGRHASDHLKGGLVGSVLRSLSRATGRDKSKDRVPV